MRYVGLEVAEVKSRLRDPARTDMWLAFAQFSLGPPAIYTHAKFQVSSFSHSGDTRGFQKLKVGYVTWPLSVGDQDPRLTQCSIGPPKCSPQTVSWSVQPFLHSESELSSETDWQIGTRCILIKISIGFLNRICIVVMQRKTYLRKIRVKDNI